MLHKFQFNLTSNFSDTTLQQIAVATSGGLDSMVLVDLLVKSNIEVTILHCNFGLRDAESDADADFVRNYATKNELPYFEHSYNTKKMASDFKLSIQMAARKLRYDWFEEKITELHISFLATAHHADDNLETLLIQLSRGTGLDGLLGIPKRNGKIIRPLLSFSRNQIENYALENKLQWREDSSNASTKYHRNKLRHKVVPILKEINPQILDNLQNTFNHLSQAQSLVADASRIMYQDFVSETFTGFIILLDRFIDLPNYEAYLYQWLKPFDFKAWQDVYDLVHAQSGKQVFSKSHCLTKNRNELILTKIDNENSDYQEYQISDIHSLVNFPLNIKFERINAIADTNSNSIFVDENKIIFPLVLRNYKEGDYFYPFGMTGKKKLNKYFKDQKISVLDKKNIWLLCSDSEIVWVVKYRLDQRFAISKDTKSILKITIL